MIIIDSITFENLSMSEVVVGEVVTILENSFGDGWWHDETKITKSYHKMFKCVLTFLHQFIGRTGIVFKFFW